MFVRGMMSRWRVVRPCWRIAGTLAVALALTCQAAAEGPDPLEAINNSFLAAHAKARTLYLDRSGPIIIADSEKLVLIHKKQRIEATVIPPLYQQLKSVAHCPLGTYLTLSLLADQNLSNDQIADLQRLNKELKAAIESLGEKGFSRQQLERQQAILQACASVLDQVVATKSCPREQLTAFARKTSPLVMANAEDATRLQLDGYDAKVAEWKRFLSEQEWQELRVIVMGSALPRKDNLAVQFFATILDEPGEGKRIIYAEALFDEAKALRLLAASNIDADAARAFFDDPTRLHRDLLAEAAAKYLRENKNQLKSRGSSSK
jgi:hypothetical protein